ncbi:hypothetical protein AGABI2DRAFT_114802 [Agaricus bisporus var. bisporus H97]|uniref:hypothetical protein n=1 Tax=Agaricus bisporus var. bisporus (strain H97 / ATCC MYA-4626 / FGSC 10389) TaxID=936046 RepID=UPI00029F5DBF|nr:hypothetical protein AGABI2DRAFT_114802 [Agaricus bisporus var. bisporus H97]EKV49716.1 hypothetical protein AGABI2DRAFT_114802 [Agaricus bisporus var. bisporus H97]
MGRWHITPSLKPNRGTQEAFYWRQSFLNALSLLLTLPAAITLMSPSTRVVDATPINLKERIAALQHLSSTSNPPPSPSLSTNNDASPSRQSPTTGVNANVKFREKIARFEKKGGVPVPRGSFGLGAPPLQDGHTKRQNELYGNRIPQPVRAASGLPGTPSPSGQSHPPSATVRPQGNNRRSYSLSSVHTLMTSEFSGGADTPLNSLSTEEPVHQSSVLSAESSGLNIPDGQDQPLVMSPLPTTVAFQGEGDNVTGTTGLPLEKDAQMAVEAGAEVPRAPDNVVTPSAYSPDLDIKPKLPSSTAMTDSPSFSLSSPSAVPSSPHLDTTTTVLPTLSPAPSTDKTLLQATTLGNPPADPVLHQPAPISKGDLVSSDDDCTIINSPVKDVALESPQSISEGSTSFSHTAKEVNEKENLGAKTAVKVDEGEADTGDKKPPPLALELNNPVAMAQSISAVPSSQPRNACKEAVQGTQQDTYSAVAADNDIASSQTTPQATQNSLPETSRSTSIKISSSLEPHTHFEASLRPASMIKAISGSNHVQSAPKEEAEIERGSVTIPDQQSYSSSRQSISSNRGVVHNKRRDDLANSRSIVSETPQTRRASSALPGNGPSSFHAPVTATTIPSLPSVSASSGFGDLSDLLQSTFLLEQTLESGNLLTEPGIPAIVADDDGDVNGEIITTRPDGVEVRKLSRGEAEENKRTLEKLQAKREEQAKSKLRSSFRNTLTRAVGGGNGGATSGADVTASSDAGESVTAAFQQEQPQYYSKRFKSPSVPHLLDSTPHSGTSRSKTPENQLGRAQKPASLTSSKSAKSRFPNFRRLTSSSNSSEGHSRRLARSSYSTSSEISSEDSSPALITPPDVTTEFGEGVKGREGSGMSWRVSSPKKGKDSMSRAATFAGKIWSRARTRSGASTLSTQSSLGRTSSETPPLLPPLPNIILPEDSESSPVLINPPARSTSLSPRSPKFSQLPSQSPDLSLSLSFDSEGTRSSTPVQSFKHSNTLSPESSSNAPTSHSRRRSEMTPASQSSPPSLRPLSWMSASSTPNSPLSMLESDFFDAFPSVPENQPLVLSPASSSSPYSRSQPQAAGPRKG